MLDFLSTPVFAISNLTESLLELLPKEDEELTLWTPHKNQTVAPFFFELKLDQDKWRHWFNKNWKLSLYISAVYLIFIYFGKLWMKNRAPYDLRRPLAAWNTSLALFSFLCIVRTIPDWAHMYSENGIHKTACIRDPYNHVSAFYGLAFAFSKVVELGDTVFIVLRKTPLIFLHWYHHMATLIFCFMGVGKAEPVHRFMGLMNVLVHSFMYTWYAAKAMRYNPPRKLAMTITLLQLSQMALGIGISLYIFYVKSVGIDCDSSIETVKLQLCMYASYFILFGNYFAHAYLIKNKFKRN